MSSPSPEKPKRVYSIEAQIQRELQRIEEDVGSYSLDVEFILLKCQVRALREVLFKWNWDENERHDYQESYLKALKEEG